MPSQRPHLNIKSSCFLGQKSFVIYLTINVLSQAEGTDLDKSPSPFSPKNVCTAS
jgi:hypothetical protein